MTLAFVLACFALGLSYLFTHLICAVIGWEFFWLAFVFLPLLFLLLYLLHLLLVTIWGLFFNKKKEIKKPNRFYYWFLQQTDALTMVLLNIRTRVTHRDLLPPHDCYLLVSNHISNFDQMIFIQEFSSRPLICVTKPENLSFPIAGPFIHHAGFIPINRDDPEEGSKAIRKASEVLIHQQGNICISPEGTRNKTEEILLPFHAGSFKAAMIAKAPIVIVSIHNSQFIHQRCPFKKSHVYINVLKTLYPEEYEEMPSQQIATLAYNLIKQDLLNNHKGV